MDTTTYGAATAAPFSDEDEARRWFRLVAARIGALDEDAGVEEAYQAVRQGADASGLGWAAEALVDYLGAESQDPLGVLRELADAGQEAEYVEASLAAAAYAQEGQEGIETGEPAAPAAEAAEGAWTGETAAPAAEGEEDASPAFDDAAWGAYLAQWQGGWDGAEQSWPTFKESFLYYAPDAVRGAAEQLVTSAEASEKVAVLAPYGITGAGPADTADTADTVDAVDAVDTAAGVTEAGGAARADQVVAAVLQDHPALTELGAERLQELFAEVVAELAAERQAAEGGAR